MLSRVLLVKIVGMLSLQRRAHGSVGASPSPNHRARMCLSISIFTSRLATSPVLASRVT